MTAAVASIFSVGSNREVRRARAAVIASTRLLAERRDDVCLSLVEALHQQADIALATAEREARP